MYGTKTQYADESDNSPPVSVFTKTLIQQVVGTFLYYGLALDFTMLVALSKIGSQQNNPTERTMSKLVWFLDYCATNPKRVVPLRNQRWQPRWRNVLSQQHTQKSDLQDPRPSPNQ